MDKFEFSFNGDTMQASLVRIFGRYVLEVTEADSNKFVDVFSLPKYYSGSNSSLFFLLTEAAGEITKNITFNTLTGQPVEDMKGKKELLLAMIIEGSEQGNIELNVTTSKL